jgi:hypothetical protein
MVSLDFGRVVPMHCRTARISFLETADAVLGSAPHVERLQESVFHTVRLPTADAPLIVVPAAP